MERAQKTSALGKIYQNNLSPSILNDDVAFEGIVNGTFKDILRLADTYVAEYSPLWPCEIAALEGSVTKQWLGIVFPKNWPFTAFMNHHLWKLFETGTFRKIHQQYFGHKTLCHEKLFEPSNMSNVIAIIMIFISGSCLAAIIFAFEMAKSSVVL